MQIMHKALSRIIPFKICRPTFHKSFGAFYEIFATKKVTKFIDF